MRRGVGKEGRFSCCLLLNSMNTLPLDLESFPNYKFNFPKAQVGTEAANLPCCLGSEHSQRTGARKEQGVDVVARGPCPGRHSGGGAQLSVAEWGHSRGPWCRQGTWLARELLEASQAAQHRGTVLAQRPPGGRPLNLAPFSEISVKHRRTRISSTRADSIARSYCPS